MLRRLLILAILITGCSPSITHDSWIDGGTAETVSDSAARTGFQDALRGLTSPELERRKAERRMFQQRHYAETLYELMLSDAPGALLAATRSRMQLKIRLPDRPLTVTIPITQPPPRPGAPASSAVPSPPMVFTLHEDLEFPADPWSPR